MNEELKIIINAETSAAQQNIKDVKDEVEKLGKESKNKSKEIKEAFTTIGDGAKKGLAVAGAAVAGAATALLALAGSTTEYRNQMAQLETAFTTAGGSAETAKNTYNDLYRVLGDTGRATEAAQHLSMLTTEEEALAEWTTICQGVYATFGDSLAVEGLAEAVNHTAKLGEVQGTLADALEWSGVNVDTFNEQLAKCNTEAEREQMIRDTLNGLYTDAASNYETNNAAILAQNEAQGRMNEAMAALGETMQPILTAFTELGATLLEKLQPVIQDLAENHLDSIKSVLESVGEAIGTVISWIVDNWEFIGTIAGVIAGISAALTVVSTVMGVVNAVMAVSPVTWIITGIVAAVAALVAVIVLCVKHWDEIKEIAVKVWDKIKEVWEKVATWFDEKVIQPIVEFFTGLWNKIKEIFGSVKDWFSEKFLGAWEGIKQAFSVFVDYFKMCWENVKAIFSVVKNVLSGNFKDAWEGIKQIFSNVSTFFKGVFDKITGIFSNIGEKIGSAIKGAVSKAINTVLSTAVSIINGFIGAINTAISLINAIPGVNISKLKKLSVPQLAKGGIVDTATLAVIGERGKEAVMPLENNTEWMDVLAKRLQPQGNTPIILQVDGKTFAEIACGAINDLTRQRGSIPLVIA
jgi:phage-related protein